MIEVPALIAWALLVHGLVYFVGESVVFMTARLALRRLVHRANDTLGHWFTLGLYCPSCAGFWLACGLDLVLPFWPNPIFAGVAAMGLMHLTSSWVPRHAFDIENDLVEVME